MSVPHVAPDLNASPADRMAALIENLSAYIEQYHGGSVRLISFDSKSLIVELGGACTGCPLSSGTIHGWIEGTVRQFFPDITEVIGVEADPPASE